MKIGIVGFGYVGSAVAASYAESQVMVYDPKYPGLSKPIAEIKRVCSVIFVCVPTPSDVTGCDTRILDNVISDLSGYTGPVIIKSTAPPQWYANVEATSGLRVAHVPEFLTQARAKYDYVNPHKIVVGCKPDLRDAITNVLLASAINFDRITNIEFCTIAEASFFKYMANNMLAMKVVINNEMSQLAGAMGLDWETLSLIAKSDSRLGNTHWSVPGPDGNYGFGGACFPKDTQALQVMADELGLEMSMLDTAIRTNHTLRITTE